MAMQGIMSSKERLLRVKSNQHVLRGLATRGVWERVV